MSRRKLSRLRVKIIRFITWLAGIGFLISASMIDSLSNVPTIICAICLGWLLIIVLANYEYLNDERRFHDYD